MGWGFIKKAFTKKDGQQDGKPQQTIEEQVDSELTKLAPQMGDKAGDPEIRQKIIDLAKRMAGDGVDLTSEKQIKAWIRKHPEALGNPNAALPETFRRETPKTGRNELCPCGSGKKYKKCCGAK